MGPIPLNSFREKRKEKFASHKGLATLMGLTIYGKFFHLKAIKTQPSGREFKAIYGMIIEFKMSKKRLKNGEKVRPNSAEIKASVREWKATYDNRTQS